MEMSEKKRRAQKLLEVVPKGTLLRMLFARLTDETAAVFTRQAIRAELRTATLEAQKAGDTAERMTRLDAQGTEIPLQELTDAKTVAGILAYQAWRAGQGEKGGSLS